MIIGRRIPQAEAYVDSRMTGVFENGLGFCTGIDDDMVVHRCNMSAAAATCHQRLM